jgi:hypothetical protein
VGTAGKFMVVQDYSPICMEPSWWLSLWTRDGILVLYVGVLWHAQRFRASGRTFSLPLLAKFLKQYSGLCPSHATNTQGMDIATGQTWGDVTALHGDILQDLGQAGPAPDLVLPPCQHFVAALGRDRVSQVADGCFCRCSNRCPRIWFLETPTVG